MRSPWTKALNRGQIGAGTSTSGPSAPYLSFAQTGANLANTITPGERVNESNDVDTCSWSRANRSLAP
jgi:hypothetical protein